MFVCIFPSKIYWTKGHDFWAQSTATLHISRELPGQQSVRRSWKIHGPLIACNVHFFRPWATSVCSSCAHFTRRQKEIPICFSTGKLVHFYRCPLPASIWLQLTEVIILVGSSAVEGLLILRSRNEEIRRFFKAGIEFIRRRFVYLFVYRIQRWKIPNEL